MTAKIRMIFAGVMLVVAAVMMVGFVFPVSEHSGSARVIEAEPVLVTTTRRGRSLGSYDAVSYVLEVQGAAQPIVYRQPGANAQYQPGDRVHVSWQTHGLFGKPLVTQMTK
jgi:hypothetical protein